MRKVFVETRNVKRAAAAVKTILIRCVGIARMALIFGGAGLGKTEFVMWLINTFFSDAVYIRIIKIMSPRWLLEELVSELGLEPAYRAKDLFNQAKEALIGTDRLVFFDEIDYLTHDSKVIETIRDLHDLTNAPFIFIGMHQADRKLKRYPHLWRRFSQVIHFEPLDREDVSSVLREICEVKIDESVIDAVFETPNLTVAMLYQWAQKTEGIARVRRISEVTAEDLFNPKRGMENNASKADKRRIKLSA